MENSLMKTIRYFIYVDLQSKIGLLSFLIRLEP
jgi:hypothetical protein